MKTDLSSYLYTIRKKLCPDGFCCDDKDKESSTYLLQYLLSSGNLRCMKAWINDSFSRGKSYEVEKKSVCEKMNN